MNALANVAVPPGVVISTLFAPAVPAGVSAVMVVVEVTDSPVAATPPTVTLAPATKFVPVIVIVVLP